MRAARTAGWMRSSTRIAEMGTSRMLFWPRIATSRAAWPLARDTTSPAEA